MVILFLKKEKSKEKIIKSKFDMPLKMRANFLLSLKWVNIEWKQVAADRHELQSITNFLSPRHCYDFRSLEY